MEKAESTASDGTHPLVNEPREEVLTTVISLIPELQMAIVCTEDGFRYSVTRRTPGVLVQELREGQTLLGTVTRKLPRLLSARALG